MTIKRLLVVIAAGLVLLAYCYVILYLLVNGVLSR